jgi:hypothetical protein
MIEKVHKNIVKQLPALFEKMEVPIDRRDVKLQERGEFVDVYACTESTTINMNFCSQTGEYLFTEIWNKKRFFWEFVGV